jgi:hypothetical protein
MWYNTHIYSLYLLKIYNHIYHDSTLNVASVINTPKVGRSVIFLLLNLRN